MQLLKQDVAWKWTEVAQTAFNNLKKASTTSLDLAFLNPDVHTELDTDVSALGLDGIFLREMVQGKQHFERRLCVLLYTGRATMGGTKRGEP